MRHYLPIFGLGIALIATGDQEVAARQGVDFTVLAEAPADATTPATPMSDEAALRAAKIPTDGAGLIEFFRKRLEAADENRLRGLVAQLGDDVFQKREQASAQLVAAGKRAKPILQEAANNADLEVAYRARESLRRIEQGATSMVVAAAARVLAQRKPDGATETLLAYLPAAEDDSVAEEVRSSLAVLAVREGQPDPVLVAALADKQPTRRAAAAVALCQAGATGQMPAIRKLLHDSDALVRLRVGLALSVAREKAALPGFIDWLADLPPQETGSAEDLLYH